MSTGTHPSREREASTKAKLGAWHSPLGGNRKPGTNRALYPLGGGTAGEGVTSTASGQNCRKLTWWWWELKLRSSDVLGPGGLLGPCCRIPGGR